jgi:hypothetical protein
VPIEVLLPFVKFQVTAIYCSFNALALKILLKVFLGHECHSELICQSAGRAFLRIAVACCRRKGAILISEFAFALGSNSGLLRAE